MATIIGSITAFIGLAIVILTIIVLRTNRVKNIVTGIVFILLGSIIVWLSSLKTGIYINTGLSESSCSILLPVFVMSLFILRGILDIREGRKNLEDRTLSQFSINGNKFKIAVGAIIVIWVVTLLIVFLSRWGR